MTQEIFQDMLRDQEPDSPRPGQDYVLYHTPSEKLAGGLNLRFPQVVDAVPPAVERNFTPWQPRISGDFLGKQPNSLL